MRILDASSCFMLALAAMAIAFKLLPVSPRGERGYAWTGLGFVVVSCIFLFSAGIHEGTGQPKIGNLFGVGREYHVLSTTTHNSAIAALIQDDNGAVHYHMLTTMPPTHFIFLLKDGKASFIPVAPSQPTQKNSAH